MWKAYVAKAFIDSLERQDRKTFESNIATTGKPITLEPHETARVDIDITFKGHNHGDPDNVLKGIIDSLFADDKLCDGSTQSTFGDSHGLVTVTVKIYEYERIK